MKVGVTGASGFIGRHVMAALENRGDQVCALVRNPSALPGFDTRPIDLARPDSLEKALEGLDGVVHAAAHIPQSYEDPAEATTCMTVNALGTLALLRACVATAVKRVIVYSGNIYRFGTTPLDEEAPISPTARAPYYLISKACGDFYADAVLRAGKLSIAILRPSAVYGPGLVRGMIPGMLSKIERRLPVVIQDGGRYRVDLVYVEDIAQATAAALHAPADGAFNLGSGATLNALEIAEELARCLGTGGDLIEVRPNNAEDPTGFSPLDIRRARGSFGYSPRDPRKGLADYVAWWRARR